MNFTKNIEQNEQPKTKSNSGRVNKFVICRCCKCGTLEEKELALTAYTDNELKLHAKYCYKCLERISGGFLGDVLKSLEGR